MKTYNEANREKINKQMSENYKLNKEKYQLRLTSDI